MIQSMTGYGSSEIDGFRVEIRSLNHRFVDISLKLPPYLSQHDLSLRNIIKERFGRGRFDISISTHDHRLTPLGINKEAAKKIYTAFLALQKELSIPGQIDINTLAGYRELLTEEEPEYNINALYTAFNEAVSILSTMRIKEGELLSRELKERAQTLNVMNDRIKALSPDLVTGWREKFSERLKLILEEVEIGSSRILQEAAIMADKLDISEEVSRIENHIRHFLEILDEGNMIGRRLDFLLQEIGREVNTMAYKVGDYVISSLIIEMKTEIEKMREQVQNIQ
ncbi:MAG: YicC/YloC family endoribonuclease [Nitrospirota bacterium]